MNRLTVALFATSDAKTDELLPLYLDAGNALLKPFGMEIEIFTTTGDKAPRRLPYRGAVFDSAGDPGTVRYQAHQTLPVGRGIPVIFCKRNTDDATSGGTEYGSTIRSSALDANNNVFWLPYILINTQLKSISGETIVHEMIHAAYGEKQPGHDGEKDSCFYDYGTDEAKAGGSPTRKLPPKHADKLRQAYWVNFAP